MSTYVFGARRRYWAALAFVVGYQMAYQPDAVNVGWFW